MPSDFGYGVTPNDPLDVDNGGITSDPNSDNDGTDAMVVGTVLLSNQSSDAGVLSSIRQNPNSRPDVAPAPAWVLTTCSGPTKMRMGDRIDGSFQ